MKWWPSPCQPGDMIRVRVGSIWHYGIFVSEDEVIQFGTPPTVPRDNAEVIVCATDMEVFCCGSIAEVAVPDREDERTRIPREETVRLARSKMGEGGYNLIHNNCEHFAWQCAFGVKKSSQEEDARRRWNSRPICDVYVAPIPAGLTVEPVVSPERQRALEETAHPELRLQRYYVWKVLEYAAGRTFFKKAEELTFRQDRLGRWSCEDFHFSLSHTRDFVAVALSNKPVGVDVEHIPDFLGKFTPESELFRSAARKVTAKGETCASPEELLELWVKKESLFKAGQSGRFHPRKLTAADGGPAFRLELAQPLYLSVCGEYAPRARFYLFEEGTAKLMPSACRSIGVSP